MKSELESGETTPIPASPQKLFAVEQVGLLLYDVLVGVEINAAQEARKLADGKPYGRE